VLVALLPRGKTTLQREHRLALADDRGSMDLWLNMLDWLSGFHFGSAAQINASNVFYNAGSHYFA
jgi:hypothetical protein